LERRPRVVASSLDRALRRCVRADLLAIDDFAVLAMDPARAKLAFQVIAERYDYRRATLITTNRPFKDWTKVFPDPLNAEVIAKRLTERAETSILALLSARPAPPTAPPESALPPPGPKTLGIEKIVWVCRCA
jgi:DNA replication protein DnaC